MSVRNLIEQHNSYGVKEVQTSFGKVYIREVPYSFVRELMKPDKEKDVLLETVGFCLCEEDGSVSFQPDEYHKLSKLTAKQLKEIESAAVDFNAPEKKIAHEKKD